MTYRLETKALPVTTKIALLKTLNHQINRLDVRIAVLAAHSRRLSNLRLLTVVIGLPVIWAAFLSLNGWVGAAAILGVIVVFAFVLRLHRRVEAAQHDLALWREIKNRHRARITLDWESLPYRHKLKVLPEHPFSSDLNMVGLRSMHHLLDTTSTPEASQRLLDWLLQTSPQPNVIAERQALLRELIPMTRFRDRLILTVHRGEQGASAQWSAGKLMQSLEDVQSSSGLRTTLFVLGALAVVNWVLFGLFVAGMLPPIWAATLILYAAVTIIRRDVVGDLFGDAMTISDALRRLGGVFDFIEQYRFASESKIESLCAPLLQSDTRPSTYMRRITQVASAASLQENFFLWLPVNAIMPWDVFFAYRLNQHKAELADRLPGWVDVWVELEALGALATFAHLNPEYTFPDVMLEASGTLLTATQIGHPLIPHTEKVCNDFTVDGQGQVFLITGSNMSGKSSFLRTLGVNMTLAYAGGVVNAQAMHIGLFRLFTCIQVTDSVIDGISYFYAEVKRLRALLDALASEDDAPLFFLIDEIFRGTNNRERLTGSQAYIKALAGRGGTGLISTHDLELVHLADALDDMRNYHFRETVADGHMHFDYTLRPGPCPTTNALVIMRMEGLPVE